MAYSYTQYVGDGVTTLFNVPFPYINPAHVHVYLDGVETGFTWHTNQTVSLAAAPADGVVVRIRRTTPVDKPVAEYKDASVLSMSDLNATSTQNLYAIQEYLDSGQDLMATVEDGTWDAKSRRIKDAADPVNDQDVVTKAWALTIPNTTLADSQAAKTAAEVAAAQAQASATTAENTADSLTGLVNTKLVPLESNISTLETGLMSLAMKQAVQAGDTDRSILMNGWLDPLSDAGEVTLTNASFVPSDNGYITNAGADNYVTALDLTTAQFLDEKGSITTFTCDTANTSGHFDAAVSARVKAGCRVVIAGVSYPIASISGDGTAANAVTFTGTLTTGAKTVGGIYGCALDGTALRLSQAISLSTTDVVPTMTGFTTGNFTVSASAYNTAEYPWMVFNNSTGYWQTPNSTVPAWLKIDCTSQVQTCGFSLTAYATNYERCPKDFILEGSNTGAFSGEQTALYTATGQIFSNGEKKSYSFSAVETYRYYRLYITAINGGAYVLLGQMELFEAQSIYPTDTYPLSLAVDCTDWTALKALARTETLNSQNIWYALSFDNGTTYSAFVSSAWLPIVRNNGGTWEYWTGSAWASASINSALGAMVQAAGVTGNRMTGATLAGLSQAQIEGSGGFTGGQTSLPVLAALYSGSSTATPVLSAMSMTSDIQPHDMVAEFNAFEAVDPDIGRAVFVMQAVDDITLDTDVKAWMRRGTGAYAQVPLVQDSAYDATRVLVRGELDMSATPGTAAQLKLTTHNNKAVRVFQAANYFKSK